MSSPIVLYSRSGPSRGWFLRTGDGEWVRFPRHVATMHLRLKLLITRQQADEILEAIITNAANPAVQERVQDILAGRWPPKYTAMP
jgi:hypothetical protein